MSRQPYREPRFSRVYEDTYLISGPLLLDLMKAVLAKDVLFRFKALGTSMLPFVHSGDTITIAPLSQKAYSNGSIVAFTRPAEERLVVHRIADLDEGQVFILGDNNSGYPDGWIPKENVLGRVIRIERNGRIIWLGLGIERLLIAWLSRRNWLLPLRSLLAKLRHRNSSIK